MEESKRRTKQWISHSFQEFVGHPSSLKTVMLLIKTVRNRLKWSTETSSIPTRLSRWSNWCSSRRCTLSFCRHSVSQASWKFSPVPQMPIMCLAAFPDRLSCNLSSLMIELIVGSLITMKVYLSLNRYHSDWLPLNLVTGSLYNEDWHCLSLRRFQILNSSQYASSKSKRIDKWYLS